jgi:hypothetical protein
MPIKDVAEQRATTSDLVFLEHPLYQDRDFLKSTRPQQVLIMQICYRIFKNVRQQCN